MIKSNWKVRTDMAKAVVFLADGCEECEALITVDLLRRAGVTVETASVSPSGSLEVVSSHGVHMLADTHADLAAYETADMVILPGGLPGTTHLGESRTVLEQCRIFAATKRVAAICAAPSVLGSLGLLQGKKATCYPGFEEKLTGAEATGARVVVDGNITTAQALGSAIPFALELVRQLMGEQAAEKVASSIHC